MSRLDRLLSGAGVLGGGPERNSEKKRDEYDKFKHGADWHLQRNYEPPETLSAKPEDLPSHPEPFRFVGRNGTSGME